MHEFDSLTLSQTTKFRLFRNKEFADNNFKFDKTAGNFSKSVEKTLWGEGEIARYKQFLLFPQCFQKTCTADS